MEQALSALASFPSAAEAAETDQKYDASIKSYVALLKALPDDVKAAIQTSPGAVLAALEPAVNSIGYLFVLDVLFKAPDTTPSGRAAVLDKILDFMLKFDAVQVRYVGSLLVSLLEEIGSGKLFSPLVAVELLATAILKIDPSGSMFTSTHLSMIRLAYSTNCIEPAFRVIDRDIVSYPNMAAAKEPKLLCEEQLRPTAYISSSTGLTNPIKSTTVLEYNVTCGLTYMSKRDWRRAEAALERVITHPSKDKAVSAIMPEAYKKWVLVAVLNRGKTPSLPPSTSAAAKIAFGTLAGFYGNIANLFGTTNAAQLKTEADANHATWEEDGNLALVTEVLASYQKWQIINLRRIYRQISISQIRKRTLSAETGEHLEKDEDVLSLVRGMIESGTLKGELQMGQNGEESYLMFHDDGTLLAEADFAKEIARSQRSIEALSREYRNANERMSGSKEYVRHVFREQKRQEKDGVDPGAGFDSQIEDEDLMVGIVAND